MGRTPKKRDTPGVIFIRLPAEEYNAAIEEIIVTRRSSFQDHVRNTLLAPTNTKRMIILLETIQRELALEGTIKTKVNNLLRDLKGIR